MNTLQINTIRCNKKSIVVSVPNKVTQRFRLTKDRFTLFQLETILKSFVRLTCKLICNRPILWLRMLKKNSSQTSILKKYYWYVANKYHQMKQNRNNCFYSKWSNKKILLKDYLTLFRPETVFICKLSTNRLIL